MMENIFLVGGKGLSLQSIKFDLRSTAFPLPAVPTPNSNWTLSNLPLSSLFDNVPLPL